MKGVFMGNQTSKIVVVAITFLIAGGLIGYALKQNKTVPSNQTTQQQPAAMLPAPAASGISDKQLALRLAMRKLWTDHVVWTREYIVASINNSPDAQPDANRLLQNQVDIGNTVSMYYGQDAGNKLADLLKQHILIAVDLINDLKKNDQAKFNDANAKWKSNANDIADFLAAANPNWSKQDLEDMMAKHLATTTQEVSDYFNKKYDQDVQDFDAVYIHILNMADTLSNGIIKQFPDKF
jgi:hypothetical protein